MRTSALIKFEQCARHHRLATVSSANLRALMGARLGRVCVNRFDAAVISTAAVAIVLPYAAPALAAAAVLLRPQAFLRCPAFAGWLLQVFLHGQRPLLPGCRHSALAARRRAYCDGAWCTSPRSNAAPVWNVRVTCGRSSDSSSSLMNVGGAVRHLSADFARSSLPWISRNVLLYCSVAGYLIRKRFLTIECVIKRHTHRCEPNFTGPFLCVHVSP